MTEKAIVDQTTILSLLAVLAILVVAHLVSIRVLPSSTSTKLRILFVWHFFDFLVHYIIEGSFLYNCFFTYTAGTSPDNFLSQPLRRYGSFYGASPTAKLWQEYAKADRRWGEADLTVISLELLTVFGAGPIATYICYLIQQGDARMWFWMIVLATGELYGGFMTFCPEWLSGSRNLDTSNFLYLWVYLFFFNMLWVWLPIWALYESYVNFALILKRAPAPGKMSRKLA